MESLRMYGSDSDDSEGRNSPPACHTGNSSPDMEMKSTGLTLSTGTIGQLQPSIPPSSSRVPLPPPPEDLLVGPSVSGSEGWSKDLLGGRVRSFPHVEGNYALHVYIPVTLPSYARNDAENFVAAAQRRIPGLQASSAGSEHYSGDGGGFEFISQKDERPKVSGEYHISLSHTVPVRIHQIESITSMLRHKLSGQKRFIVEFGSWDVFTNDERTRTFLSMEVTNLGLAEIRKQVTVVNDVFKLHNLPAFYNNPRPHISLAWAVGDVESAMKAVADDICAKIRGKALWSTQVRRMDSKVGQRVYNVWGHAG